MDTEKLDQFLFLPVVLAKLFRRTIFFLLKDTIKIRIQSPNQKIPDRKTKCVIKTHINIKQNVIFGAKLKPV